MRDSPSFARVVFNLPLKEAFTYVIPPSLHNLVKVGIRVQVPFGRRRMVGYVVELSRETEAGFQLKAIEDVLDLTPILSNELLKLTRWISEYYQVSWGETLKAALPTGLEDCYRERFALTTSGQENLGAQSSGKSLMDLLSQIGREPGRTLKQIQHKMKKKFSAHAFAQAKKLGWIAINTQTPSATAAYTYQHLARVIQNSHPQKEIEELLTRSPKQRKIYKLLLGKERTVKELTALIPSPSAALGQLKKKELIMVDRVRTRRASKPVGTILPSEKALAFTPDQKKVFHTFSQAIERSSYQTFLLQGVTGSGKTEIYIRCIEKTLALGRQAIVLVPEISLTPQTVDLFRRRFGDGVAILHSGLSNTGRYLEWKNILEGKVSIAVGARSAVFAPFSRLGLIIIDEEHDPSYKQDSNPRYHARDTAIVRARGTKATVLLGSATPSLESRWNAETGKYGYLVLRKRVQQRLLPIVKILDMCQERKERKNFSILSIDLRNAIRSRLKNKEQVFLFLNRRGVANYVYCKECGFVFYCERCSVSLTFHRKENHLRCHYCNFTSRLPKTCADCRGEAIRFQGFGTQKLQIDVQRLFPWARILRLDRDTTRKQSDFESAFWNMREGAVDILIGTQMITKGHDFPNVTLVGVISADIALNIPDFRSGERTFQLLTQVAGRAGRGKIPGQVIIQTQNPHHYVHKFVLNHDYDGFYQKELQSREKLNYPPFTKLISLEIESTEEALGLKFVQNLTGALGKQLSKMRGIEILGPAPAALYRINNKFRWRLILRASTQDRLLRFITENQEIGSFKKSVAGKVKLIIDVDPIHLL